ncbi:MAG: fibronectin type III domain-containing protein, partial [bacterium]|nr:fibronectin type III domain-containing protein [Candidatus Kapabacteria bacterium]
SIVLYRRVFGSTVWGSAITVHPSATEYVDTSVAIGTAYEYRIVRHSLVGSTQVTAFGFICSGIDVPARESRGRIILVVDSTHTASLAKELSRLESDLVGDGWSVVRRDVSRAASVVDIKNIIRREYDADRTNTRTVFLFGHIPVPYAGNIAPDGHPDHRGAWPADVYYAEMDGAWTDTATHASSAGHNRNEAGDGRFDQSALPDPVDMEIGRVDLAAMPLFNANETELLRRYLDKDHAYRHGITPVVQRGLVDDNFGLSTGEAFAANAWRNFSAIVGTSNVAAQDWLTTLRNETYLFAYGCGPGSYMSASGVATTNDIASVERGAIFNMIFGSYFGDWDVENSLLRAPLAAGQGLTNCWVGRPFWYLHAMAMGETIGSGARLSQNNAGEYFTRHARSVHISLMGDPTLRVNPVRPPSNVQATIVKSGDAQLTWTASPEAGATYNVYRSVQPGGAFVKLNEAPVTGTTFLARRSLLAQTTEYMVRAVALTTTPSGSFFNPSQGVFAKATQASPLVPFVNAAIRVGRLPDIQ